MKCIFETILHVYKPQLIIPVPLIKTECSVFTYVL